MSKKTIALIPIDNRPVCYQLPKQIVGINDGYELLLPPRDLLGDLTKSADIVGLFKWLAEIPSDCNYIILTLDTLAHGGLINSRRSDDTLQTILNRLDKLKQILISKKATVFAFSSVMRISNNNVNEEEKEYWNKWGKKIFDWSYNFHLSQKGNDNEALRKHSCIETTIPQDILDDYLETRKRNFEVNLTYLQWLKEGVLDFVVYSKDDCAKYGLNVLESEQLSEKIISEKLNATIKTGADEIPLTLIGRVMSKEKTLKIMTVYTQPEFVDKISKYEDLTVEKSVNSQIELSGCKSVANYDEADLVLLVNNFKNEQGELVMNVYEEGFDRDFDLPSSKPTAIADILNANGADNSFTKTLLKKDLKNIVAYGAWNTTGNTLGSVLATAISTMISKNKNKEALKVALFTRLCDDWAYQANVRKILKEKNCFEANKDMLPFVDVINNKLETDFHPGYSFPWNRHFEIEIKI